MSSEWAVQNTITKNIDDIVPYDSNPREHAPEQIEQVANSIKEFGWTMPILVDENNEIIAGHGRLLAGKSLGIKEVPCIVAKGWSDEKKKAYCIADNKLTENSTWSKDFLKLNFEFLIDNEFDLGLTGFSTDEIAKIVPDFMIEEGLTDEDEVPEIEDNPITKEGDIWILGEHRLMCGDSTNIEQVDKLINNNKIEIMFTDPPYNVQFNGRSGKFDVIKNDDLETNEFNNFIKEFVNTFKSLNINTYYICCNWAFYGILEQMLNPKACIVWAKNVFGLGKGYRHQHEFILFDGLIDPSITNESDLWQIKKDSKYQHPTQKPVALAQRAIINSTKEGNYVLDLFGGSGSTLIACQKNIRKSCTMELDTKYCDVIVKRWQNFTGKDAVLESTGELFNKLK